ncbi:uncharacterized protein NPIL_259941 [Nephila pilipes]|uniref:Major facilitator superfamily (MFS) profile domain-containing protein n=1 Tax=Nephila pilipes TaxID=299642 RepID=A0A8X6IXG0_NEPPI|nr:uncharacterized protein NPIL_259941 [Nephila pilipes]
MCLDRYRKWKIALICCYINFLYFGIARLSSLLYLAALTQYNVNRSQASFPFILCYTVRNLAGPLIGCLGTKFQIQSVIQWGSVLASIGIGCCYFAKDIYAVIILWGVVYALGFGMATVSIPEVLSQNFSEYLTTANGIAFSGECIGGFLLPPLLVQFLDIYGLSGAFLILCGLVLTSIPAALLLNPVYYQTVTKASQKVTDSLFRSEQSSEAAKLFPSINGVYNEIFEPEPSVLIETTVPSMTKKPDLHVEETLSHSINIPTGKERTLYFSEKLFKSFFRAREDSLSHSYVEIKGKMIMRSFEIEDSTISYSYPGVIQKKNKYKIVLRKESNSLLLKKQNCSKHYGTLDKEITADQMFTCNFQKNPPVPPISKKISLFEPFLVFFDFTFILILVTQSLVLYNYTMFLTIVVDFSRDSGLSSKQEIIVLVCMSIGDMIGRIGLGWLTDLGFISKVSFSALCCFIMSTTFGCLYFVKDFIFICFIDFVLGLGLGGFLIVCPGVISDHIEEDKRPMALAARFFLYALLSLTQSPLIGYIRGELGSYDWMLVILAVNCLLSLLISFFIPFAARRRDKRKASEEEIDESFVLIEREEHFWNY